MEVSASVGQLFTIVIMAVALGMDAFSLGIGIGMKGVSLPDMFRIGMIVGIFHVLMPLMGMFAGHYVGALLGDVALYAGGGLLTLLGLHMIYSSFRGPEVSTMDHRSFLGILIFALSVSIDSFSVGISLGLFAADLALTVSLFGMFGAGMSMAGLVLGNRVSQWLGDYGEALGGVILLVFGVKFLL